MKKQKLLAILFAVILTLSSFTMAGCGSKAKESLTEFCFDITIDQTVLYDENDIRITANRLARKGDSGMLLFLKCENNTKEKIKIYAGSVSDNDGRVALTVNGQDFNNSTAAEGYTKLKAGNSDEMRVFISKKEAEEKGIYLIETIDLGISIRTDTNGIGDYIYPLTLEVKEK